MFTKEQMKILETNGYPKHFDTVLISKYKRGTTSKENNLLADLYDAATGEKISRQFSCKTCVYELYRKAGLLYKETLNYYLSHKNEEEPEEEPEETPEEEEPEYEGNLPNEYPIPEPNYATPKKKARKTTNKKKTTK